MVCADRDNGSKSERQVGNMGNPRNNKQGIANNRRAYLLYFDNCLHDRLKILHEDAESFPKKQNAYILHYVQNWPDKDVWPNGKALDVRLPWHGVIMIANMCHSTNQEIHGSIPCSFIFCPFFFNIQFL